MTPLAEIHSTVEEAFLIRGDVLVGTRGELSPGSYFWRPGLIEHGPLASRNGTLFCFRTKLGGLDLETVETPGWQELVREYRAPGSPTTAAERRLLGRLKARLE